MRGHGSSYLAGLSAVVFTQSDTKLQRIGHELKAHARTLLDQDCRIIVQAVERRELNGLSIIARAVKEGKLAAVGLPSEDPAKKTLGHGSEPGEPPLPHVRVYGESASWSAVANFIMEHPAGPAPSQTLKLTVGGIENDSQLPAGYGPLLRRAFYDCADVYLSPMDDGRSGVNVYCAYAELEASIHGRWPLPYFVKIGDRQKVFEEYMNYEDNVDPYVPFHLGPHLIRERCCLGAKLGVIVGDFVEGSESLVDCARDGRAASAISCLFDRTLGGWHRGAQRKDDESCQLGKGFLSRFPRPNRLSAGRFERACELGATKTLLELRALFECCTSSPVLVGPIHGDLHAANVRVRATDAIVIDFYAHKLGPLVYDAACLEASLLVDGFACRNRAQIGASEWLRSIESLYDHVPLEDVPTHPNPKNPSCWYHACVRQIRLYAREMEHGEYQYAAALALALLIKATKDSDAQEPEASARAIAYVLAERVLSNTFAKKEGGS